jgi:hypothetical protein
MQHRNLLLRDWSLYVDSSRDTSLWNSSLDGKLRRIVDFSCRRQPSFCDFDKCVSQLEWPNAEYREERNYRHIVQRSIPSVLWNGNLQLWRLHWIIHELLPRVHDGDLQRTNAFPGSAQKREWVQDSSYCQCKRRRHRNLMQPRFAADRRPPCLLCKRFAFRFISHHWRCPLLRPCRIRPLQSHSHFQGAKRSNVLWFELCREHRLGKRHQNVHLRQVPHDSGILDEVRFQDLRY